MLSKSYKTHPLKSEIDQERYQLFVKEVGPRMLGGGLFAFIVAMYFNQVLIQPVGLIWLTIAGIASYTSFSILRVYRQQDDVVAEGALNRWRVANTYMSLIWAVVWAAVPWVFLEQVQLFEFMVTLLFIVMMSSIPSISMGAYPEIYISFITPVFFSLSTYVWMSNIDASVALTVVTLVAWALLCGFSLLIHRNQIEAIIQHVELIDTQQKLQSVNQAKAFMIAMMGHDLKQPLEACKLILHQDYEDVNELRRMLGNGLLTLSSNLDEVLHKSTISDARNLVDTSNVSVLNLLGEVATLFSPRMKQYDISYSQNLTDITLRTDKTLLSSVVENIFANIIEHANPRTLHVSSHASEQISLKFIAAHKRVPIIQPNKSLSGHGIMMIQRLSSMLGCQILWYTEGTDKEVTELIFQG